MTLLLSLTLLALATLNAVTFYQRQALHKELREHNRQASHYRLLLALSPQNKKYETKMKYHEQDARLIELKLMK